MLLGTLEQCVCVFVRVGEKVAIVTKVLITMEGQWLKEWGGGGN